MQGRPIKEYRADGKYITKTYVCDSFGAEKNIDLADNNPFRYCSEYYDKGIDKIYLRARSYDPTMGRFTQQDPIKSGTNWYVYANNNPVRYADSNGLSITLSGTDDEKKRYSRNLNCFPMTVLF